MLQVKRDNHARSTVNRRRQNMTIRRIGQHQVADAMLESRYQRVARVLVHQIANLFSLSDASRVWRPVALDVPAA